MKRTLTVTRVDVDVIDVTTALSAFREFVPGHVTVTAADGQVRAEWICDGRPPTVGDQYTIEIVRV